jgi:hypothetical protein
VIILALPIPTLAKVKRNTHQKLALFGVFGAGALSTISSCVRLYTINIYTTSKDPLYDAAPINLWSFIEINLGIACASGPGQYPQTPREFTATNQTLHLSIESPLRPSQR